MQEKSIGLEPLSGLPGCRMQDLRSDKQTNKDAFEGKWDLLVLLESNLGLGLRAMSTTVVP
jgi:hypothetical protein